MFTDNIHVGCRGSFVLPDGSLDLKIGEALLLGKAQEFHRHVLKSVVGVHVLVGLDDVLQLIEEPFVDLGEVVDLIYRVAGAHSLGDHEDALVGRLPESLLQVGDLKLLVAHEAVRPLADHPEALLDGLLETAPDGHHLAHGLHRRTDLAGDTVELAEIPARNLADNVVKRRLEEGRSGLGHGFLEVEQAVAETEFGGHEGERIAGGLGGKRRGAAQTGVHLDHTVVHSVRVEGELHVALAHYPDVADNPDGKLAQEVVVIVGQGLGRSHDDALSGVDSERVEVLHVADSDTVVIAVADNFIFNLLPAFKRLFHKHLRRE